ncbi:AAA family ATPase [Paenibacillus sp. NPDC058071]|uniref:AAA family ATPase n=1 Tax=Paenibacillus sp. NPDC058071 TaxID=3346326 RepID=UPI0036DAEC73
MDSPMELSDFMVLSILITEMVCREHQHHTVIGCLSPANISIHLTENIAVLSERVEWHAAAYCSPEQTGRINHIPDERSDLYVLGVILYELLNGRLPFQPQGGEDWGTAHIHRLPQPPLAHRKEDDGSLQAVLLKLLAKSPEDRYQSAYGLLDDLRQFENRLKNGEPSTSFEIGRMDNVRSFRYPDRLYGWSAEWERLESGLEQAAEGLKAVRWVAGSEGIGKTALVHRLRSKAVRLGGRFVEGSADPIRPMRPYEPLLQAVTQWMHQLWSEPADRIERFKEELQARLGEEEMRTLAALLPEARPLFEENHNEGIAVPYDSADNRFGELLLELLRCLAAGMPPLVLFIDNLQWADKGTHAVIRALALEDQTPGLLLIGACRTDDNGGFLENNGERAHVQESAWLAERWQNHPLELLALLPWSQEETNQYVSDIVQENSARIRLLAGSIYDRTGGYPHSVRLLLESWLKEKKLGFDEKRRQWVWDSEVIRQMNESEPNRRLMEASFAKLSDALKRVLATAAAIGPVFRLQLLGEACELTPDAAISLLHEAELGGIICREEDTEPFNGQDIGYLFVHDYLRQLAYSFEPEQNAERHWKIGSILQQRLPSMSEELTLAAVDHFNLGVSVMSAQEKLQLAEHNLHAGLNALDGGRYAKGVRYAEAGLRLVAEPSGVESEALVIRLRLALAWSEYLCGHAEKAKRILQDLEQGEENLTRADRSLIWTPLIQFHAFIDSETAIHYGKMALQAYGWKLRERGSKLSILKEIVLTQTLLYRNRNKLHQWPMNRDNDYAALCQHVVQLAFPLLLTDPESLVELFARFIRYGLQRGMNEWLAFIIGIYELLLRRVFSEYSEAASFAIPSLLPSISVSESGTKHRLAYIIGLSEQLQQPREASAYLNKAMRHGLELGDKDFANMAWVTCLITHNDNLYALAELLSYFNERIQKNAGEKMLELAQIADSYLASLQDDSLLNSFIAIPPGGLSGQPLEDNYGYVCKLEAAYLSGHYREALFWAKCGRENELPSDWARIRKHRFYETMALAALYPEAAAEERKQIGRALRKQLQKMKKWKGFLGHHSSAQLLLMAEKERITRGQQKAISQYAAAIKQARIEKYGLMEAIACERLGVYYEREVRSRAGAMISLMDACTAYSLWGLTAKVTQIRTRHADLLHTAAKTYEGPVLEYRNEASIIGEQLSLTESPAESSVNDNELLQQIIDWSGNPGNGAWPDSLLEAALRQSGADRGLVLQSAGSEGYRIAAHSEPLPSEAAASDRFAESVLRHIAVTKKPIIIFDARQSHFITDPYIQEQEPRSILCMPVVIPGQGSSLLLYLENRQVPGVFTDRDVKVLELIAARMIYFKMLEDGADAAPYAAASAITENVAKSESELTADNEVGSLYTAQSDIPGLVEQLTVREIEILTALAEGLSNREIAERLAIAETTVKTHTTRIFGKLGVKRRGQAVIRAKELQLVD